MYAIRSYYEEAGSQLNRAFGMWAVGMGHLAIGEYEQARVPLEAAVAFVDTAAPGGRPWLPSYNFV